MKKILTSGTFTSYRHKTDGSFSLTVNIMIPSKEQINTIIDMFQREVIVYMREGEQVTEEEIGIIDNVDIEIGTTKTPSQRLRGVLYRMYEQNNLGYMDFKDYYKHQYEKLIDHFKAKLS